MADNLLDKASILLTPTAYNDGSMLSVKPENGDGDFTFSRGSAATRVNAQGLVENVQIISSELVSNGDFSQEGSELVTDGDFSNGSANWTLDGTNAPIVENGLLKFSFSNGTYSKAIQNIGIVNAKITYTVVNSNVSTFQLRDYGGANAQLIPATVGTHTIYRNFTGNGINFQSGGVDSGILEIDNVSVKEVGQNWNLGSFTSIGNNVANIVNSTGELSLQQNIGVSQKTIKLTYTISNYASGGIRPQYGAVNGLNRSANGTYTEIITGANASSDLSFFSVTANTTATITNISVKEITDDTDIPRINYSGFSYQDSLGSELVVNGDFSNGSANFLKSNNVYITTNSCNFDNTSDNTAVCFIQQNAILQSSKSYKVTINVSNYVTGDLKLIGVSGSADFQITQSGQYTLNVEATQINLVITCDSGVDCNVTIDNVSVKEVLGQEVVPDSGCGNWLLEPQSTNLITYSEDFSQSFYAKDSGVSVGSSNNTSPSGDMNATQINVTDNGRIYANMSSLTYYSSVFIKAGTFSYFKFAGINVDLVSKTIVNGKIESYGNGWFRISVPYTGNRPFQIQAYPDATYSSHTTSGNYYIWGFQAEQQSYPTSYIPTNGAIATRLADAATNSGNASLINSTEGVLYAEFSSNSNDNKSNWINISDGTSNNWLFIGKDNLQVRAHLKANNVLIFSNTSTAMVDRNKVALSYKSGSIKLYINGAEALNLNNTFSFSTALNQLNFNSYNGGFIQTQAEWRALAVYKEALTDAQLQSLTTI